MQIKRVVVKCLHEDAIIPRYAYSTDSGADLYSIQTVIIEPQSHRKIKTGISIELPEGYEFQVRSKSGIADKNDVFVLNSPGTVDTDYRGEIQVLLYNLSDKPSLVEKGSKIAQLVLAPVTHAEFVELERLENRFGSTGIHESVNNVSQGIHSIGGWEDDTDEDKKDNNAVSKSSKSIWIDNNGSQSGFLNGMLSME